MSALHVAILVADLLLLVAFVMLLRRRGRRTTPFLLAAVAGVALVFIGATVVLLTT